MKLPAILFLSACFFSPHAVSGIDVQFKGEDVYDGKDVCPEGAPILIHNRFVVSKSVDMRLLHIVYVPINQPSKGVPSIEPARTFNNSGEIVHTYCTGIGSKNVYKVRFYNSETGEQSNVMDVIHSEVKRESVMPNPPDLNRVTNR